MQTETLLSLACLQRTVDAGRANCREVSYSQHDPERLTQVPFPSADYPRTPIGGALDTDRQFSRVDLCKFISKSQFSTACKSTIRRSLQELEGGGVVNSTTDARQRKQYSPTQVGYRLLYHRFAAIAFEIRLPIEQKWTVRMPPQFVDAYRSTATGDSCLSVILDPIRSEAMITRVLANYEVQGPHIIPATRTRLTEPIKRLYGGTTSTDRRAIQRLVERGLITESPASDGESDERAYRLSKTGKDAIVKCLLILAVSIGIHVRIE